MVLPPAVEYGALNKQALRRFEREVTGADLSNSTTDIYRSPEWQGIATQGLGLVKPQSACKATLGHRCSSQESFSRLCRS